MLNLAAVRREYIAERILVTPDAEKPKDKVQKFLVMFRDKTGDVYLLDKVPPRLQDPVKRRKYFRDEEILPAITFGVDEGILSAENHTENPLLLQEVEAFLNDANSGLGVAYLLSWEFVTHDFIKAANASNNFVASAGRKTVADAVAEAEQNYEQHLAEVSRKVRKTLGMSDFRSGASLAPASKDQDEDFEPQNDAIDVHATTVDEDQQSTPTTKAEWMALAKELGIQVNKKMSVQTIVEAINEFRLSEMAERERIESELGVK